MRESRTANEILLEKRQMLQEVDQIAADELKLYIDNDGELYRRQTQPIIKNLMKKRAKGVFDIKKAAKLFMYLVDAGAKKYNKDFGTPGPGFGAFDKATRMAVAKEMAEEFATNADDGYYD